MKFLEKKIIFQAILLTLTLSITAGVYLIYRAWDYWSADQAYADMEKNAVQKVKMAGQPDRYREDLTIDSSGKKSEGGQDGGEAPSDNAGEERKKSADDTDRSIDGTTIPDKPVIDWDELSKSGRDIVAWLDIPSLGIAYPVVQGNDNEFYLHHLPNGEYKNAGSLFMEAANNPDLTDVNTVIYGHNMDNGSMFGKFRNMTEEDYETQPFLWLCTKEKDCLYKMISLHISLVDDESYTLFKSNGEVNRLNYENSIVTGWLRAENQRSYIHMPVPKSALGRVITLSTCASLSDERRVLQAVLVREIARPP
jgi:sortase B